VFFLGPPVLFFCRECGALCERYSRALCFLFSPLWSSLPVWSVGTSRDVAYFGFFGDLSSPHPARFSSFSLLFPYVRSQLPCPAQAPIFWFGCRPSPVSPIRLYLRLPLLWPPLPPRRTVLMTPRQLGDVSSVSSNSVRMEPTPIFQTPFMFAEVWSSACWTLSCRLHLGWGTQHPQHHTSFPRPLRPRHSTPQFGLTVLIPSWFPGPSLTPCIPKTHSKRNPLIFPYPYMSPFPDSLAFNDLSPPEFLPTP